MARVAKRERREFQLSDRASKAIDKLADTYGCNFSDVIEGLLLGTIDARVAHAMAEHGLSAEEIAFASSHGITITE